MIGRYCGVASHVESRCVCDECAWSEREDDPCAQADGTLPPAERRNYTGVVHALTDIVKKEGIGGLFTGASTTAVRAMALNCG